MGTRGFVGRFEYVGIPVPFCLVTCLSYDRAKRRACGWWPGGGRWSAAGQYRSSGQCMRDEGVHAWPVSHTVSAEGAYVRGVRWSVDSGQLVGEVGDRVLKSELGELVAQVGWSQAG